MIERGRWATCTASATRLQDNNSKMTCPTEDAGTEAAAAAVVAAAAAALDEEVVVGERIASTAGLVVTVVAFDTASPSNHWDKASLLRSQSGMG